MPRRRPGGTEVREVEREHGHLVPLGDCHYGGIDEAEIEIRVPGIQLDRSSQQPWRHEGDRVLTRRERSKEQARRLHADPSPHEMIDFDGNRIGNHEVTSKAAHQCGGQCMRRIAAIDRREDRPGVGNNGQRPASASRMYSSARKLRSGGPSPEPT